MGKLAIIAASAASLIVATAGVRAETTAAQVEDAKNTAELAKHQANAATAYATAQAALTASELANTKAEIANIQAALTMSKASELRAVGSVTAPTVNAAYYASLSRDVTTWLGTSGASTPTKSLQDKGCKSVFLVRPNLPVMMQNYQAVGARLDSLSSNLNAATAKLDAALRPGQKRAAFAPAATLALGVGLVDVAAKLASAAKPITAIRTDGLTKAADVVNAAVAQSITNTGSIAFYDTDTALAVTYANWGQGVCGPNPKTLTEKAACVTQALTDAQTKLASVPAQPTDSVKAAATALTTLNTQATTLFQSLFTADPGGNIPFSLASQGEALSGALSAPNACLLSVKVPTADADSLARDGTFSSYKLLIEMTTTVAWSVSAPSGQILSAGTHLIATDWTRMKLEP